MRRGTYLKSGSYNCVHLNIFILIWFCFGWFCFCFVLFSCFSFVCLFLATANKNHPSFNSFLQIFSTVLPSHLKFSGFDPSIMADVHNKIFLIKAMIAFHVFLVSLSNTAHADMLYRAGTLKIIQR